MKIQINGIIEKQSQAGKTYWEVQTNKGNMSAFDGPIVNKLYEAWRGQKEVEVDAKPSQDGKYVNIRRLIDGTEQERNREYEAAYPQPETPMKLDGRAVTVQKPQDLGRNQRVMEGEEDKLINFNPTSMYVSYAKDIFIALQPCKEIKETMIYAIELVKQAHKAFS